MIRPVFPGNGSAIPPLTHLAVLFAEREVAYCRRFVLKRLPLLDSQHLLTGEVAAQGHRHRPIPLAMKIAVIELVLQNKLVTRGNK